MTRRADLLQFDSEIPAAPLGTAVCLLRSLLGTPHIALYTVHSGRIVRRYVSPGAASQAEEVWAQHRHELLGGDSVRTELAIYLPIVDDRVIGVLEAMAPGSPPSDIFGTSMLACTLRMMPEVLASFSGGGEQGAAEPLPGPGRHAADGRHVMRVALQEVERRKLQRSLDRNEWVVSAVARDLKVDRATIYRKMSIFGIGRETPSPKDPRHGPRGRRLRPRFSCS